MTSTNQELFLGPTKIFSVYVEEMIFHNLSPNHFAHTECWKLSVKGMDTLDLWSERPFMLTSKAHGRDINFNYLSIVLI